MKIESNIEELRKMVDALIDLQKKAFENILTLHRKVKKLEKRLDELERMI